MEKKKTIWCDSTTYNIFVNWRCGSSGRRPAGKESSNASTTKRKKEREKQRKKERERERKKKERKDGGREERENTFVLEEDRQKNRK
jgi:hypothetical protein